MAEVFLARAGDPERLVVIKRLRAQLAVEPEFVRMFLAEGRLALTLRHPNVVEVFDVDEAGEGSGQFYIAMEYLHGHDLRETMTELIERHASVRLDQALSVARAVAAGLHYTHEHTGPDGQQLGIVHRDVSPHNVLLTFDGRVKLVDFGIAKTISPQTHTRTGVLKGKAAYMAPEQAMGQALDRRSDVFCLGILMWEMTTGLRLFRRATELETLNAVAQERAPRPSRIVPRYPRDLENLIMKTLAHAREDRWATAGELIDAIDELARRRKVTLGPDPVRALTAAAFAEELAAWRAVQAFGISLSDHLVARNDRETTRPNDTDLATEDDRARLPIPVFEMTRQERPARSRRWWPLMAAGAVAALAAVATAGWFAMRGGDVARSAAPLPAPVVQTPAASSAPGAAATVGAGSGSAAMLTPGSPATSASASPAQATEPTSATAGAAQAGATEPTSATAGAVQAGAIESATGTAGSAIEPTSRPAAAPAMPSRSALPARSPAKPRTPTPAPAHRAVAPPAALPSPVAAPATRAPVKPPSPPPSPADLDKLP